MMQHEINEIHNSFDIFLREDEIQFEIQNGIEGTKHYRASSSLMQCCSISQEDELNHSYSALQLHLS